MTLEEMKKVVLQDSELKNLKIHDIDVYKLYQYLQDRNDHVNKDGYESVLITDPYIEIVYRPTKEKAIEIKQRKIREHLKFYDSEVYIQDASLSRFEVFSEERMKAYQVAKEFLDNYRKDRYAKGLYIYGKNATGKSYLLSAVAHELAQKNITVLFVYMPDLVRSIKHGMNEGNLEERINQLKQADVLMIDDIGGENMTPWFRDEILVPIMQYRLSAKLPVFMTSNYDFQRLVDFLSVNRDETSLMKAARLVQRIKDLMTPVKLVEDQYKPKNA
ncbi:MAG: primosomal protein DnaI [Acholeplasmataceae bacterium]|jgi:primosomal protein DnaI|nr:primosomal protein DnaI [Acholeplasmataceae bacterium]